MKFFLYLFFLIIGTKYIFIICNYTIGFSPLMNLEGLVYKPFLENITIFLSKLAHMSKNLY